MTRWIARPEDLTAPSLGNIVYNVEKLENHLNAQV